jgi:hypothetical protein
MILRVLLLLRYLKNRSLKSRRIMKKLKVGRKEKKMMI